MNFSIDPGTATFITGMFSMWIAYMELRFKNKLRCGSKQCQNVIKAVLEGKEIVTPNGEAK